MVYVYDINVGGGGYYTTAIEDAVARGDLRQDRYGELHAVAGRPDVRPTVNEQISSLNAASAAANRINATPGRSVYNQETPGTPAWYAQEQQTRETAMGPSALDFGAGGKFDTTPQDVMKYKTAEGLSYFASRAEVADTWARGSTIADKYRLNPFEPGTTSFFKRASEIEQRRSQVDWDKPGYMFRPGYTDTNKIRTAYEFAGMSDLQIANKANQRQMEMFSAGKNREGQYYLDILGKVQGQNAVERSSWYHHAAMDTGIAQPPNPYENAGDFGLLFLKGGQDYYKGQMGNYNPGAGSILAMVPSEGLQGQAWDYGRQQGLTELGRTAPSPGVFDFSAAIGRVEQAKGEWGPYGFLRGGPYEGMAGAPRASQSSGELQGLPAPFVTMGKDPVSTTVYRPSDLSMAYANADANLPFGLAGLRTRIADFVEPGTFETTTKTPGVSTPRKMLQGGAADFTGMFIEPTTGRPTSKLTETGIPYIGTETTAGIAAAKTQEDFFTRLKASERTPGYESLLAGGISSGVVTLEGNLIKGKPVMQSVQTFDWNAPIPIVKTTTSSRPAEGGFAYGEEQFAKATTMRLFPAINPRPATESPIEKVGSFAREHYEGFRQQPLTFAISGAMVLGIVAGGELIAPAVPAISALASGTRFAPLGSALTWAAKRNIAPLVMTGIYGRGVVERVTLGGTDYTSSAAWGRLGRISSTEIMPGMVGGAIYPSLYGGLRKQEIDIKAFMQENPQAGKIDYIKASTRAAAEGGSAFVTTPVRATINDYLYMKQEGLLNPKVMGPNTRIYSQSGGETSFSTGKMPSGSSPIEIMGAMESGRGVPSTFTGTFTPSAPPASTFATGAPPEAIFGKAAPGVSESAFIAEYFKYKASLPGQYAMAKGEAGMMWAVQTKARLGEVPAELYKGYLGTKTGFQTKASELEINYYNYKLSGAPESNLIGYGQSKIYPAYFNAKIQAPIMAENALISGETALWKFGQYAKTPGITIKAFMQEPVFTGGTVGKLKVANGMKYDFTVREESSRLTKSNVGQNSYTLKPERSLDYLKKQGGIDVGSNEPTSIVKKWGGRGGKASETMKPMDLSKAQGKQSQIALQMIMTEQLPGMEQMTSPGRAPTMAVGYNFFQTQVPRATVQTEQMFAAQPQRKREMVAQMMSFEVMQSQRQRQTTSFEKGLINPMSVVGVSRQARQREALVQDQWRGAGLISGSRSGLTQFSSQGLRSITDQTIGQTTRQTPRQTTTQFPELTITQVPRVPTTTIPRTPRPDIPFVPPTFSWPTGTDTGRGGRGRSKNPFREVIGIKSLLSGGSAKVISRKKQSTKRKKR